LERDDDAPVQGSATFLQFLMLDLHVAQAHVMSAETVTEDALVLMLEITKRSGQQAVESP
jgi:hypothetical protein